MRFATDKAVWQLLTELLDVSQTAPHEALDRQHSIQRISRCGRLGDFAHFNPISVIAHGGRQNNLPSGIGQRLGKAATHGGDQRIGGTQINPHGQTTLVWLGALSGLSDLQ
jgi:hypothetical protein